MAQTEEGVTVVQTDAGRADMFLVLGGFAVIVVGAVIAWLITNWLDPDTPVTPEGLNIFAALYVAAQGLERFLEPISRWVGEEEKQEAKEQLAAAVSAGLTQGVAQAKKDLARARANRAVIFWVVATFLAMLLSGITGLYFFRLIGVDAPRGLDILLTGLAIGGGTKPLHDLIARIEKSKEKAEAEPGGGPAPAAGTLGAGTGAAGGGSASL